MIKIDKVPKQWIKCVLVLLVVVVVFSCLSITASAAVAKPSGANQTVAEWDEYAEDRLNNSIKYIVYTLCKWKYVGLNWVMSNCQWLFDWNVSVTAQGWISAIQTTTAAIGKILCFIFFLLDLLDHATRENFTIEILVKQFAKLIVMCILFEPENLRLISNFGGALGDKIFSAVQRSLENDSMMTALDTLIEELRSESWIKSIVRLFSVHHGIAGLVQLLVIIASLFVGIGRLIELVIYRAMLPLGMASIYNGGVHSSGFRYIKKCIALEIQGAIMFAVFIGSTFASEAIALPAGLTEITGLALGIAAMAVVAKSKQIANDIVGV